MNFHILMAASHLSISNGYFQSKMNETMQQRGLRSTGCDAETDMVKPWRAWAADCPDGACLLVEYWCAGGDGFVRSGFKMEEAGGVMN